SQVSTSQLPAESQAGGGQSPPAAAPPSDSPASASQSSAANAAAGSADSGTSRRLRIGSQRPDTPRSKTRPQSHDGGQARPEKTSPVPNIRDRLPAELELEVAAAFGDLSLEDALEPSSATAPAKMLEPESRHKARVISVHHDDVFIELGPRDQGILSLRQFHQPPEPGQAVDVIVGRFDPEEGLYQLSVPGGPVEVGDWSQVNEGAIVEARVTGHNKGGLECDVSQLRGFIPASQIAAYRVEDLAQFVGEKMLCVVTEANPEKRNLVLSRRALLERERAEAKDKLMAQLAEGQVREGTVRSLQDFGAFVDLGGVDGLLHVSQLSWKRVKHPSEVLAVGQQVKVMIKKIDPESGKISLAFRDLTENPWNHAAIRYPITSRVQGTVTRIMDFGAFVELESGIEGLVHISEIAHSRVFRIRDFLKEGDEIEAKVLSVDPQQQRMSLSIKAIQARPEPIKKEPEMPEEEPAPLPPSKRATPLKGGVERPSGGDQFGLKW
ncbi:MAG TPA: S1 RNA-binding domain-containing protein, partial [Pirellulales bacterium]|nr:S1 RNA-binding domain-containing protein [Pirellulales bacterium]